MADENVHKQFFHVRNLKTKTVTLYPARAHIVREIPNITLAPGQNEIEIYGFATTVDEQSLQIEGAGDLSAAITDITVNAVPNKEHFDDIHDVLEEEESDLEDYEDSTDDSVAVKQAKTFLLQHQSALEKTEEEINSAEAQLAALAGYISSLTAKDADAKNFSDSIVTYYQERRRVARILSDARRTQSAQQELCNRKEWELRKVEKAERLQNKDAIATKMKERNKRQRERQERRAEAMRKRKELAAYWPVNVYRVVVRLETSIDTPGPSRRNSITTPIDGAPEPSEKAMKEPNRSVGLSISYVTSGAFWLPRYDLNISSIHKSAQITYRAEVRNGTTETWKNAKVILSTSQTSYSGLEDKVPTMNAWQVTLNRNGLENALLSNAEAFQLASRKNIALQSYAQARHAAHAPTGFNAISSSAHTSKSKAPRDHRTSFGMTSSYAAAAAPPPPPPLPSFAAPPPPPSFQMQQSQQAQQVQQPQFVLNSGVSSATTSKRMMGGNLFGSMRGAPHQAENTSADEGSSTLNEEVATLFGQPQREELDFEESAWEDYGLTATYELPGIRTLEPSSLARRHKIATLNATNILLNHIAVPKLRAAAFLRAKIRNPSSTVTLLKGNAGITLDGSFLGNIPLQRVSPNQIFNISLGVDPAIHISYPKPTLHRSTQGIFSKERSNVFSRSISISNTKPVPVELLVLDQVPISQDERLRIDVLQPRGLFKEGDAVRCGQPANEASNKPWGKATATFKKDGEISWTADIEKGQACIFKFEYEAKMPSTDFLANA